MFKNILSGAEGIDALGIFSLVVFFIFFSVMVIWVIRVKESYLNKMSSLPLDETESINPQTEFEIK